MSPSLIKRTFKKVKLIDCGDDDREYPAVPYYGDLVPFDEPPDEPDGNKKEPPKRYGQRVCECGAEATYGKDTTHSTWCPKSKLSTFKNDREDSCV